MPVVFGQGVPSSQGALDALVSLTDAAFCIIDSGANILALNAAFAGCFGLDEDEANPRTWDELTSLVRAFRMNGEALPPDDWPVIHALRTGETVSSVRIRVQRSHSPAHTVLSCRAARFVDEGRPGAIMLVTEVAEAALPDPMAILHTIDSAVAIFDNHFGKILYANPAFLRLAGFEERVPTDPQSVDDWAKDWEQYDAWGRPLPPAEWPVQKLLRGEEMRAVEVTSRNRFTGHQFTAIWNGACIRNAAGERVGLLLSAADVSQRKEAELALRQSEERYRQLFELESDAVMLVDVRSGAVLTVNAAASELYGYTRDEFLKLNQLDLTLEPEDTLKARLAQQPFTTLRWHKKRDGTRMRVEIASRFVELDGKPASIAAIRDISGKERMEAALRKSEEKFRKVFLTSPLLMCISRLEDGFIVDANDAFERLSGYLKEEAIGHTTLELGLWSPEQRAEIVHQARAAGRVRNKELELRTRSGERKTVLFSGETVEVGGETMLISSVVDITEQLRANEQVRSLATAVEQAGEAVVITDINANIRYCNPAFERITGYRFEEVVNRNPRILKSGSHGPDFYRKMWAEITAGGNWKGRLTNRRKDGSLYEEESTISPIRSADGTISGFVAMKRDVTAQVQLERQLAQAQKMESVGRLAGGIAHDFNNLLTVINGYGELLATSIPEDSPLGAYAREVCKAGERAASLTRQLLAFSRKQAVQFKPLDLDALIRDSENMLRRLIGDDISLATALGLGGGRVMGDSGQLHQVVMNLVLNARDAMPTGGLIQVETTRVTLDEASLAAEPNAKPGTWFVLTVTDTGFGMDEATRQRIFEPFFTSKKGERGTGLGLSTVYGVVTQMGGWIDVWSQPGVGTTFKLFVPPATRAALSSIEHEPAPEHARTGETILLVEDQEAVREIMKATLVARGYTVLEASNGEAAVALAGSHPGEIHLLLCDLVLPGFNGTELARSIRASRPQTKVLLTSGLPQDHVLTQSMAPHMSYIAKPFVADHLVRKVRAVIDDSTLV